MRLVFSSSVSNTVALSTALLAVMGAGSVGDAAASAKEAEGNNLGYRGAAEEAEGGYAYPAGYAEGAEGGLVYGDAAASVKEAQGAHRREPPGSHAIYYRGAAPYAEEAEGWYGYNLDENESVPGDGGEIISTTTTTSTTTTSTTTTSTTTMTTNGHSNLRGANP